MMHFLTGVIVHARAHCALCLVVKTAIGATNHFSELLLLLVRTVCFPLLMIRSAHNMMIPMGGIMITVVRNHKNHAQIVGKGGKVKLAPSACG